MEKQRRSYGAALQAGELQGFIDHLVRVNLEAEAAGRRKAPLCIWGRHGIGKTEIVQDYARQQGYPLVYIAPAQFEEMGDLLGMPRVERRGEIEVTTFRPPDWAPVEAGPGILLIDDVNRADDRILRGLMQLLQDFRLVSWALPPRWQIVLTANPDEGDYSVTPMDRSLLTRMRHVTLEFDLTAWVRWAQRQGVDDRGIQFLLNFPDSMTGRRTTPRTLVQFFESIAGIEDLEAELPLVQALGEASLDEETVAAFVAFVQQQLYRLPGPEELLSTEHFKKEIEVPLEKMVTGEVLRVDILAGFSTRLLYHLEQKTQLSGRELDNLKSFLLLDFLPNDLRMRLTQGMAASGQAQLLEVLADPEVGGRFLSS